MADSQDMMTKAWELLEGATTATAEAASLLRDRNDNYAATAMRLEAELGALAERVRRLSNQRLAGNSRCSDRV